MVDIADYQGGKKFGQLKQKQEMTLEEINQEYLEGGDYDEYEDLADRLIGYKKQFMEYDIDNSGDIDKFELKLMLEKLGQPKTHLECQKMIKEVDKTNSGTISYREFLDMMLGRRNSVLRLILMFEDKASQKENNKGVPPKKTFDDLP